jgi:acetolactate synthase-1/2/3 large subunit
MTTWNGADRYGSEQENYWGRPNTWGQRSANILIQQSDCLVVIGSRLGLQQTGFAWQEFAPLAKIFQVDVDEHELNKGHPKIFKGQACDAGEFLDLMVNAISSLELDFKEWLNFGQGVIEAFPLNDPMNQTSLGFVDPFDFVRELSSQLISSDVIIPCSSGGAFTVMLQGFRQKYGQVMVSNKGLASMGYGLSAALGAAESTQQRTILVEGDGGFAQNLQELGTVRQSNLNLKIFIFSNSGYASIRMTQRNYFGGAYLGCDIDTGLGMPKWEFIAQAYDLPYREIKNHEKMSDQLGDILREDCPSLTVINIDPEQTYYPKITSRVLSDGSMASNPLHLMSPDLSYEQIRDYLPYLADTIQT